MFDAKVILAFVESVELFVADVANETRLFEVGVDVMVELVLTAHWLLTNVAEKSRTKFEE